MVAAYPTALVADLRALADPALKHGSFEQAALRLVVGEKKILLLAHGAFSHAIARLPSSK